LFPGYSDITRFLPWSTIATGNHMDRAQKIPNLRRRLAPLTFLILVQSFRDPQLGDLLHVQIVMTDRPNYLTWSALLLSYWFSKNPAFFEDYLVNLINDLLVGHSFCIVQDEAHHRWKNHHVSTVPHRFWRWHTMVYGSPMIRTE